MSNPTNVRATDPVSPKPRRKPGPRYYELVHKFPLRSIQNEAELDRAIAMIDTLIDRGSKLTRDEDDYLDTLADLVRSYEDAHDPMPPLDTAGTLRDRIDERGLTLKALSEMTGLGISTLSEISTGKRPMTRKHIEKLAAALGVKPAVFLP